MYGMRKTLYILLNQLQSTNSEYLTLNAERLDTNADIRCSCSTANTHYIVQKCTSKGI